MTWQAKQALSIWEQQGPSNTNSICIKLVAHTKAQRNLLVMQNDMCCVRHLRRCLSFAHARTTLTMLASSDEDQENVFRVAQNDGSITELLLPSWRQSVPIPCTRVYSTMRPSWGIWPKLGAFSDSAPTATGAETVTNSAAMWWSKYPIFYKRLPFVTTSLV